MTDIAEKAPSIGVSLQVPFLNQRTLVMQSYVERDCEPRELNALLDKLRTAADRQKAFVDIEVTKQALEEAHKQADKQALRMQQVDENIKRIWANGGRRGDVMLTEKEKADQLTAIQNAEKIQNDIGQLSTEMERLQNVIGA
jgi:hypothetical protein